MNEFELENEYDLGPEFELAVVSAIFNCEGFFDKYHSVILPETFKSPKTRSILDFIQRHFDEYRRVPDKAVIIDAIQMSAHRTPADLINLIDNGLPEIKDPAYIANRIINWTKWRSIDVVLGDPEAKRNPREFAIRIDQASREGDSLLLKHTKLDEDEEDEYVRNEIISTPWNWLNDRLLGGPEKTDFIVVLTIINGGKTTILTNVARHTVGLGHHVIFFTFEDGEKKIKRRLLQCINGWTTEQIISDLHTARRRRDHFLSVNGGCLHIKRLRSRRDTVDDAMSFVRAVEESTKRKVDVVITDYADRFKPQGRYSEPRHGLREVYEDCKFLASDLDVIHYTASQVNKLKIGQDVIGIGDGAESYGKFESADICLGFGQTLEDQQLGRITLHTSKMRDAEKGETLALVADFEVQRIYQTDDDSMKRSRRRKGRR